MDRVGRAPQIMAVKDRLSGMVVGENGAFARKRSIVECWSKMYLWKLRIGKHESAEGAIIRRKTLVVDMGGVMVIAELADGVWFMVVLMRQKHVQGLECPT
jgi:hypothetical protein